MNKVILMGRLTRDPEVRYKAGDNATAVARFSIAVDRKYKREGEPSADFINCVAFGKTAEFAERYLRQGTKIALSGRIQTGSYTNRDGHKVYTTDIVVEELEFAESKAAASEHSQHTSTPKSSASTSVSTDTEGFMQIPDGIDDELPFA